MGWCQMMLPCMEPTGGWSQWVVGAAWQATVLPVVYKINSCCFFECGFSIVHLIVFGLLNTVWAFSTGRTGHRSTSVCSTRYHAIFDCFSIFHFARWQLDIISNYTSTLQSNKTSVTLAVDTCLTRNLPSVEIIVLKYIYYIYSIVYYFLSSAFTICGLFFYLPAIH